MKKVVAKTIIHNVGEVVFYDDNSTVFKSTSGSIEDVPQGYTNFTFMGVSFDKHYPIFRGIRAVVRDNSLYNRYELYLLWNRMQQLPLYERIFDVFIKQKEERSR